MSSSTSPDAGPPLTGLPPAASQSVASAAVPKPASDGGATLTAEAIGRAAAQSLSQVLGPLMNTVLQLIQALPNVIAQAIPHDMCAPCLIDRLTWEAAHKPQLEAAFKLACKGAGLPEGDPRAQGVDVTPFLPEELRGTNLASPVRMPQIQNAVTTIDGKLVCPGHAVPNVGGPRLLAVTGSFNPAMLGTGPR